MPQPYATATMPPPPPAPGRCIDHGATPDERTYATFLNLVGLSNILSGIPLIGLLATLIMWQVKKTASPFLDDHGREAMNFQISLVIYAAGFMVIGFVFGIVTFGVGFFLFPVFWFAGVIFQLIGNIRGAMAAQRGEYYRYPMTIRILSAR